MGAKWEMELLVAPTKGTTTFLGFFSTSAAATNEMRHVKVGKELVNALLFQKSCLSHFVNEILTYNSFS